MLVIAAVWITAAAALSSLSLQHLQLLVSSASIILIIFKLNLWQPPKKGQAKQICGTVSHNSMHQGLWLFLNDSCLYFNSNLGPRAPKDLINTTWTGWREITCRPNGRYSSQILTFIRLWTRHIIQNQNYSLLWNVVNGDSRENLFFYVFTGTAKSQDNLYELDTWP